MKQFVVTFYAPRDHRTYGPFATQESANRFAVMLLTRERPSFAQVSSMQKVLDQFTTDTGRFIFQDEWPMDIAAMPMTSPFSMPGDFEKAED